MAMTTEDRIPVLVFKDEGGDYFLVPQELLERGRVPDEHKDEVERRITDDAAGHAAQTTGGVMAQVGLFLLAYGATKVLDAVDWGAVLGSGTPPSRIQGTSLSRPL
jgi:hypothetical protein